MSKQQDTEVSLSGAQNLFAPGTQLLGRFQVVQRLSDDQGSSFLCKRITPPHQGDLVVLKIFGKARVSEDPEKAMTRFQHEIVAAFSVKHENVSGILETVRIDDVFGYLTEYADGDTLASLIESEKTIDVAKVVHITKQICAGTQAIHAAGIVHRGLKPGNISVTKFGKVKIRDFGLAKLEGQKRLTQAGALVGTLAYVSPEYVLEGICDSRLDIYSIGIICYEMLCGVTPFESEDFVKMFTARVTKPVPRPETITPSCPKELSEVLMKALQPNPKNRYQTVTEMLTALETVPVSPPEAAFHFGGDLGMKQSRATHVFSKSQLRSAGEHPAVAARPDSVPEDSQPEVLDIPRSALDEKRVPQSTRTLSGAIMDKIRRTFWGKKA